VDFDDAEIEAFVARWTTAMEAQAMGEGAVARADAALERRELLDAIARNAGVRRLAANPLLLTILALMKRQGVTLPERRVQLYDQYVATLLSSWNRARGLGRPPARDLDVVQTVRILAPLALWMHEVAPGVGLVKRAALRRRLEAIYAARGEDAPETAARRFLADVRERAGLLLERGAGTYGFIHLTFEEYLAAVAIALRGQGDCQPIVDQLRAHVGDPAWREVALLTVAYVGIVQQLDHVAGEVVEALACDPAASCAEAVVLAGEAVLDAGESGVSPASRARVVEALVRTMQDAETETRLRQRAGWVLGRLGWRPEDLDAFVWIPSGPFLYGDNRQDRVIARPYGIGKYPVTNLQYARFIEDSGYTCQVFWSDRGWAWREEEERMQPRYWDNVELNNPIFPVVGVSYYEAEAYCAWLTAKLAEDGPDAWVVAMRAGLENGVRQMASIKHDSCGLTFVVRLPTEEEWERAARGTDGRVYPWGEGFNPAFANTEESKLETTTAVCTYPQGVSPVGAWDMSGNIWEWTSSWWDEREQYRVFRGGAWFWDKESARCASRNLVDDDFYDDYGVRVGVSLVNSES
jgi:formylglycine-generating enzyme required for sulfatase activity